MDLKAHLTRAMAFSRATFGPGPRTEGVIDHITKELEEVRNAENLTARADEWVDVVILGLDGLTRCLADQYPNVPFDMLAAHAVNRIASKQGRNELRTWPDWRTADPNKAIEHDRTGE